LASAFTDKEPVSSRNKAALQHCVCGLIGQAHMPVQLITQAGAG